MNKVLLYLIVISCSFVQAEEKAVQKPIGYEAFPPEIRLQVFKNYIKPAFTLGELNELIKNFASWDKLNYQLIKNKKEPKHEWFVKAIKDQKAEIKKQNALVQAQQMFDDLAKLGDITKIDLLKNGPNATVWGKPVLHKIIFMAQLNEPNPAEVWVNNPDYKNINFKWYRDLIKLLLIAGADPNSKDAELTSLGWLINKRDLKRNLDINNIEELIKLLVDYSADINAIYGKLSILDLAIVNNQPEEIIYYLYDLGARSRHYQWKPIQKLP